MHGETETPDTEHVGGSKVNVLVDLKGRLSNPPEIAETLVVQGPERVGGSSQGVETTQVRPYGDHVEGPREEKGRLSNPPERRLSPTDIDDLV